MRSLILGLLGLILFSPENIVAQQTHELRESSRIFRMLDSIKLYSRECRERVPDKAAVEIEKEGLKAIPTLLKAMTSEGKNYKGDTNKPAFVSACIIEAITDKINPLDWQAIGRTILENEDAGTKLLLAGEDKYKFRDEIIRQLKMKQIVDCFEKNGRIRCIAMQ